MSREQRRVQLAAGYVLHHRVYRETGRILEVYAREHGRITLFARGVRGPKARLAGLLQPFQPLLLSWSGRGEAAQLTHAELAGAPGPLPPERVLAAFYLSELVLKLTTRHDPLPALFDAYHETLGSLRLPGPLEPLLRIFEKRLLAAIGYGLELHTEAQAGERVQAGEYYHFQPEVGVVPAVRNRTGAYAGASLLALANEALSGARELEDARRLLQSALAQCLEGRPLATRAVARAVVRGGAGAAMLKERSSS